VKVAAEHFALLERPEFGLAARTATELLALRLALHRTFTDQAARAIELAVAATNAEGRTGVFDGGGELGTATRVTAESA
jgi:hypothetical protein